MLCYSYKRYSKCFKHKLPELCHLVQVEGGHGPPQDPSWSDISWKLELGLTSEQLATKLRLNGLPEWLLNSESC